MARTPLADTVASSTVSAATAAPLGDDENRSPNDAVAAGPARMSADATSAKNNSAVSNAEAAVRAREARFLASQSARTAERRSRAAAGGGSGRDDDDGQQQQQHRRSEFWSRFRSRCSELSERVELLLSDGAEYVTATQRAEGRAELDSILRSVRGLERHCLGTSSAHSLASPCDDGASDMMPPIPDNLPQGDVRLIGEEIAKLTNMVDNARDVVCPPELFVFRRYRALMEERAKDQKKNGGQHDGRALEKDPIKVAAESESNCRAGEKEEGIHYGATLRGKTRCSIVVEADGTVKTVTLPSDRCESETQISDTSSDASSGEPLASASVSSLLIKDLDDCHVLLKGKYQSIHVINANRTTIDVTPSSPVSGPVHVTACHDTVISVACRQLRIHDCTGVTFRVHVRSGPIIENCRGMVFRGDFCRGGAAGVVDADGADLGENMFRDVKDFNWLRSLVKSPNFVVVEENEEENGQDNLGGAGFHGSVVTSGEVSREEVASVTTQEIGADESDDEDEL